MLGVWPLILLSVVVSVSSLAPYGSESQSEPSGPQPPLFLTEPPNLILLNSTLGVSVPCSVYGRPAPVLDWVREDEAGLVSVTDVDGILKLLPNNTLHFLPFPEDSLLPLIHNGRFRCVAGNEVGRILSRKVKVKTVVTSHYTDYNVRVSEAYVTLGSTAVFQCVINPYYVRDYVRVTSWSRGDVTIIPGDDTSIMSSGDLHLRRVESEDSVASYKCHTFNILTGEEKTSGPGMLYINEAVPSLPIITATSPQVTTGKGHSVELPCVASGFPVPQYSWSVDGHSVGSGAMRGGNLVLSDVNANDSNTYVCSARNDLGETRASTRLTVQVPLSARIEPAQQVTDVGEDAVFTCVVSGNPVESVRWYRDGEPLRPSTRVTIVSERVVRVSAVESGDRGVYQCMASNADEESQASVQLAIGVAAPRIFDTFIVTYTSVGGGVSLHCAASGNPSPTIEWSLDGGPIPLDDRFQVAQHTRGNGDVISYVNVSSISVQDGGVYHCAAVSDVGTDSHSAKLIVYGVPYIRPMSNVTVVARETLHVPCYVSGYPIESITWMRDDAVLPINHRQQVSVDGLLTITHVDKYDAGQYICLARNGQGRGMRRHVFIVVIEPPSIDSFYFPERRQGERVSVTCVISSGDLPIQIRWLLDNQPVQNGTGIVVQKMSAYTSQLSIGNVRSYHSGNYTCVATNAATTSSYTTQLRVDVAPEWVVEPADGFVVEGGAVTLDCQTTGDPQPTVTWSRARGTTPSNYTVLEESAHIHILENGSLFMESVQMSGMGYYLCHSSNSIGGGLSKVVHLTVHVPAHFITGHDIYTVKAGKNISMECTAIGDHPISVAWNFNGGGLDWPYGGRLKVLYTDTPTGRSSTLVISEAIAEDSGFYMCNAKNMFGSDSFAIRLMVMERPEAVVGMVVVETTSTSILLQWQPPYNGNSPIRAYIIQYTSRTDDERSPIITNLSVSANETQARVWGLHPAREYDFTVFAVNDMGPGLPSGGLPATTQEDVPSGEPREVKVIGAGATSLKVTWQAPWEEEQNGQILGYYIGYKIFNSSVPFMYLTALEQEHLLPEQNEYMCVITNLNKFTRYSLHVQAFNSRGAGPQSADINVLTLEDVPSAAPSGVLSHAISSQSIMVLWSPPPLYTLHGILQGYRVLYRPVTTDEDESDEDFVDTQELSLILTGLLKYTNYTIQVLAYTRMGHGVRSPPIYTRTQPDVPTRPADIKVAAAGPTSVMVSWKPPLHTNGLVIKYTLVMQDRSQQQEVENKMDVRGEQESHLVDDLSANHQYRVHVYASTVMGRGEATRDAIVTTHEYVAASILSFSSLVYTHYHKDVLLPCLAVGTPTPVITWKADGGLVEDNDHLRVSDNGSLLILDVQTSHAANYSCRAENVHGADEVQFSLSVQVDKKQGTPPKQPLLSVALATNTNIQVNWKSGSNGGSRIEGFRVEYWDEHMRDSKHSLQLPATSRSFTASELLCGSRYYFCVFAFNNMGKGPPSNTLVVHTNGSAPIMPPQSIIVTSVNATFIDLDLSTWQTGGCSINWFDIEVQYWGATHWQPVESHIPPNVSDYRVILRPDTWYRMRITAHNDAGSTECLLKFTTNPYTSTGTLKPLHVIHKYEVPFYHQPYIMIPMCGSIVLILVLGVAIVLHYKRRKQQYKYKEENACNIRRDLTTETSLMSDVDKCPDTTSPQHMYTSQPSMENINHGNKEENYYTPLPNPRLAFGISQTDHLSTDIIQKSLQKEDTASDNNGPQSNQGIVTPDSIEIVNHPPIKLPPPPIPLRTFSNHPGQRMSLVSTVSSNNDELLQALGGPLTPAAPVSPDRDSALSNETDTSLRHFTQSPARPNEARQAICEVPMYPDKSEMEDNSSTTMPRKTLPLFQQIMKHRHPIRQECSSGSMQTSCSSPTVSTVTSVSGSLSHGLAHIEENSPLVMHPSLSNEPDNDNVNRYYHPLSCDQEKSHDECTQQLGDYSGETTVV